MADEELTFEQATAKIDVIVGLLERGDAPLDKSLEMFEEGAKLIKMCSKMLDEAEQKVKGLQTGTGQSICDTEQVEEYRETLFDGDE